MRRTRRLLLVLACAALASCQSPSDPNETVDLLDVTVTPDPSAANGPSGRFYTIEHDEEPDEVREYDWHTTFTITVRLTEDADNENVGLDLPLDVTSATVVVQQASGGIVTPPTGGQTEKYEFVIAQSSSNRFTAIGGTVSMTFDVWYDLPNLRKEALVNVTLGFRDDDTFSFTEVVPVKVGP
jgi:hypothetical protein